MLGPHRPSLPPTLRRPAYTVPTTNRRKPHDNRFLHLVKRDVSEERGPKGEQVMRRKRPTRLRGSKKLNVGVAAAIEDVYHQGSRYLCPNTPAVASSKVIFIRCRPRTPIGFARRMSTTIDVSPTVICVLSRDYFLIGVDEPMS